MRGNRTMDNQRSRMNLPTRHNVRSGNSSRTSQEKNTDLTDLSPCHFDSGNVSDMDLKFESGTNLEEGDEEENEKKQTSTSQNWADSGVHLDSGLGIESMTSDLDLRSPTECLPVYEETSLEHKVESDFYIYQDKDGDSPLHLAVVHGDPHLVFRILALYPEYLDVTNHLSQTALHLAVLLDSVRIVRRLVVCGARLHICDHRGDTPLHLACRLGHLESLRALTIPVISKEVQEAGLKQDPLPHTPLRLNPRVLQQRNYEGLSCTHLALARSHKVLEYVLQCGADINAKEGKSGKTVLHVCVEKGQLELVRFLLSVCKADVNARNYAQQTPLHLALLQKRCRPGSSNSRMAMMIRLLREHGGEPHELPQDSDQETDKEDDEDED